MALLRGLIIVLSLRKQRVYLWSKSKLHTLFFFMNSKEIKEVVLLLNTSQASKNIDNLKNKLEETRRLKEEAFNKGDDKAFKKLGQEEQKIERQ